MSFDRERLIALLPAIYAQRDAEAGGALRDLLGLLSEQILVLEENLAELYDDQFIETSAEWVVPYIGDLIGYRTLHNVSASVGRARAEVAHTIDFRRRKGTVSVLEGLARDVTGWRSAASEYFQRLITTQYMNHVRLHITAAPDLRRSRQLELVGTAFDSIPRSVDVRRIESRRGRHNIPNVGLFVWRLQPYSLRFAPALSVDTRRYRFHPLNIDQPLFTLPVDVEPRTALVGPRNVPTRLARSVLDEDVTTLSRPGQFYADADALRSLRLFLDRDDGAGLVPLSRNEVCVCNLATTVVPDVAWAHAPAAGGKVAIDPVLGRIYLPPEATDAWRVAVTFHYGFPADIGGGEYERAASFDDNASAVVRVPDDFPTIQQAINALGGSGLVLVNDNGRYEESLSIDVSADSRVEIRAANDKRPSVVLTADFTIRGGANSVVRLNGLLISGDRLFVPAGGGNALAELDIRHCTLVPGIALKPDLTPVSPDDPSLVVELANFKLTIDRSIVGALRVPEGAAVRATDSAIDSTRVDGLVFAAPDEAPGAAIELEGCTVVGRITVRRMPLVSNCILLADAPAGVPPVHSVLRQQGCVRFTWLPATSRTPRRHRCLPESAPDLKSTLPRFTALRYGSPGYLQLNVRSGPMLMRGADDETEPGVYHHLANTRRETNLRVRLDEYLRVGLEAGIFHET